MAIPFRISFAEGIIYSHTRPKNRENGSPENTQPRHLCKRSFTQTLPKHPKTFIPIRHQQHKQHSPRTTQGKPNIAALVNSSLMFRIPTGFRPKAQGCPASRELPWVDAETVPTPTGLRLCSSKTRTVPKPVVSTTPDRCQITRTVRRFAEVNVSYPYSRPSGAAVRCSALVRPQCRHHKNPLQSMLRRKHHHRRRKCQSQPESPHR
jgi:hypothetical protein